MQQNILSTMYRGGLGLLTVALFLALMGATLAAQTGTDAITELRAAEAIAQESPSTGNNDFAWAWFLALPVGLGALLVGLILLTSILRSPRNINIIAQPLRVHPFSDVESLAALAVLSPEQRSILAALGVHSTYDLWLAESEEIAQILGVSVSVVHHWQRIAELSSISTISTDDALLLAESGVFTIAGLKKLSSKDLLAKIRRPNSVTGVHTVDEPRAALWIDHAKTHTFAL